MYTTVNAGLYARLSVEDENNQISESIQTQKAMLTDYCREKGYRIVDYYVDDGKTGTNFERPEFQRMLRDIEAGKINTVICKDLSRFGRNYYEAGMYLDKYFVERNRYQKWCWRISAGRPGSLNTAAQDTCSSCWKNSRLVTRKNWNSRKRMQSRHANGLIS